MSAINNNVIEPRLQYNYAKIRLESGLCVGCMTFSYEIIDEEYIPVPRASNEYVGKYYNQLNGKWYYEAEFITEFII